MKTKNTIDQLNRIEEILSGQINKPMSFEEACKYLNCSKSFLYKCTHKHSIPFYKPSGKKIFFSKKDLDEWIFKTRIRSEAELDKVILEEYAKTTF